MGLVRMIAELGVLLVACSLSFIIGVGVAVHHVRAAMPDAEIERTEHRKRPA